MTLVPTLRLLEDPDTFPEGVSTGVTHEVVGESTHVHSRSKKSTLLTPDLFNSLKQVPVSSHMPSVLRLGPSTQGVGWAQPRRDGDTPGRSTDLPRGVGTSLTRRWDLGRKGHDGLGRRGSGPVM